MIRNSQQSPSPVLLSDYQPPDWLIPLVEMTFELGVEETRVRSVMQLRRNPEAVDSRAALKLDGEQLELQGIWIDGLQLASDSYELDDHCLTINSPTDAFELTIENTISPASNTALEGLYRSGELLCTQCEAEGFRRITWFLDRPDVLSTYRVKLIADKQVLPVLLGNGNLVGSGELEDGRHWALWDDPFPKPSYLFAIVAGDLRCVADEFTSFTGKKIGLEVWVEPGNEDRCEHALQCMAAAMRWDEQAYGREYDLERYIIVAVNDFNMGAMENKGLNLFNAQYVLASPETATDDDYAAIEAIIGHEYFHNWSGNRVTLRDWFQLSLKEGFTVFREQQFVAAQAAEQAAGHGAEAIPRIEDVKRLRAMQFPEDAGPTAHPVRPAQYAEINNLYTATVYEKGAEVVRMLHGLIGADAFRAGSDRYFAEHDGAAVRVEEFVAAMQASTPIDLAPFMNWYHQAGTPEIDITEQYNAAEQRYRLTLKQSCPATPGQPDKSPAMIPVAAALLVPGQGVSHEQVLLLDEAEKTFEFDAVPAPPVPSLLRGFSAPVNRLDSRQSTSLLTIVAEETDGYARWEALQALYVDALVQLQSGKAFDSAELMAVLQKLLANERDAAGLRAVLLGLPDLRWLVEQRELENPETGLIDIDQLTLARKQLKQTIAEVAGEIWQQLAAADAETADARRLRNLALDYLCSLDDPTAGMKLAVQQYESAANMTDAMGALRAAMQVDTAETEGMLVQFSERWSSLPLVMNKWFSLQAMAEVRDIVERVQQLSAHDQFDNRNPNKIRALFGVFAQTNLAGFHRADGAGYRLIADQVMRLDGVNPQVAARLVGAFNRWRRFSADRQAQVKAVLEGIRNKQDLSPDVADIVARALADEAA